MLNRHPHLIAALLLLLVSVALFMPYLVQPDSLMWPRSELGTDMLTYNWPSVYFFRDSLHQFGQIPLWQGTSAGGLPMIGNPAIRVFYPPQFLISLLPIPILWGYALLNVFHFWLAGMGGYGLARLILKVNFRVALLAGLLIMLTPRLSSNVVGDVGYTHGLCWMPLCLLWMRLAIDRRSWRWAIAAGLALCCIYLNNIQYILYAGWLVGLYFLYSCAGLIAERRPVRLWLGHIGILAVIFAAFIGFSAFQSFTFASYLPYQSRQAMTLADANYLALPPIALLNTIFPISQKFPEWEVYAGLLPLMFAPLARLHSSRRELWWWLGLLIFAVLFSLGSVTPLYSVMFYVVPGFSFLRVPARMWYVAAIALVMLTALALDAVLQRGSIPARGWRWLWGSGILLIVITLVGRYLTRRPGELDWALGFLASVGVILTLLALRGWQGGRLSAAVLTGIIGVALVLDLFPLDLAFGTPRPMSDFLQTPALVKTMIRRAGNEPYRVYSVRREITDPVALVNGLQTADGLNSFQFGSYARFMRIASGCNLSGLAAAVPPCASNEISETAYLNTRPDPALLGLLNVRFVISPFDLSDSSLHLIETTGEDRLYENRASLPRAFTVGKVEVVEGDAWSRLSEIKPDSAALLESSQPVNFALPDAEFGGVGNVTRYTPNEIRVTADLPQNGLLVLGEPWTPGWSADVDGQSASVLRVDGALRGIYLEAGTHIVTFTFRPTAFVVGLVVSFLTVLVCTVLWLLGLRRRHAGHNNDSGSSD